MAALHVIYDGQCLFCLRALRVVRALDLRKALVFHDANERAAVLAQFPQLAGADLDDAMFVVDGSGKVHRGFHGFRRIAWSSPLTVWLAPLLHLPGVGWAGERVYGVVARNRRRLGCRIDAGPGAC